MERVLKQFNATKFIVKSKVVKIKMEIKMKNLMFEIISGKRVTKEEALELFGYESEDLFLASSKIRKKYKGNKIKVCSIINAKSGKCSENCKFCAQSTFNKTDVKVYPLVDTEKIKEVSTRALENVGCFGIVSSGNSLNDEEISKLCEMFKTHKKVSHLGVSIGKISDETFIKLKEAGIKKMHHNLETSENFYPNICSTHSYQERVDTLKRAKKFGFELCSGGLFGMGESLKDRIDLAFTLKELGSDSVPMNFFMPIKGTALAHLPTMMPIEILKTIAVFRIILQNPDIMICGGRELHLRDIQSWIFQAGANGMMTGGYLTTNGRDIAADKQMIKDLGLELEIE
ncbi:MAG: biotin synthase BioB [Endomicrobium sp.]|nr:biotin synthase BioB [Endomicrobium sp.]